MAQPTWFLSYYIGFWSYIRVNEVFKVLKAVHLLRANNHKTSIYSYPRVMVIQNGVHPTEET
jgi:hypothetical protein